MIDWQHIRSTRFCDDRPPDWPEGVFGISLNGTNLLGVHEQNNKLYWDGKEIVTRNTIRLGDFERWMAFLTTFGVVGTFLVEAGSAAGWW